MLLLGLLGRGGRPLQVKISVLWLFVLNHQISLPPSPCYRKGGLGMLQVTCRFTSGNLPENPPGLTYISPAFAKASQGYGKRSWEEACTILLEVSPLAAWGLPDLWSVVRHDGQSSVGRGPLCSERQILCQKTSSCRGPPGQR